MLKQIPRPPGYPIVGNLFDGRDEVPIRGLSNLADKYGPIYKLSFPNGFGGYELVVISSVQLLAELSDEKRFHKVVSAGLDQLGGDGPQGLFRSKSEADPDWEQAHRVLVPAFGPLSIIDIFDEMHEIATQLILKWARKGPGYRIAVTQDFTRLTLDTIALCAMGYRFNSFYQEEMHPYVKAMLNTLTIANESPTLFGIVRNRTTGGKQKQLQEDRNTMNKIANDVVKQRREHPTEKKDLLNAMIKGKDPKTGETMRDELITANMVSFLTAGHETTSGLLSFAFTLLLKSPAAYKRAQAEVDNIIGQGQLKVEHLKQFEYLNAVLRETLRLQPTAPAFSRGLQPNNNEASPSLGGYAIDHRTKILALLPRCHRDPEVYGADANEFKPERMLDEKFSRLPKSAWKPFGTGVKACIGRPFAWQEALLAMALVLQSFDLRLDDPAYELRIQQTLTIKPRDLYMHASPRNGMDATAMQRMMMADASSIHASEDSVSQQTPHKSQKLKSLLILYGSNTGTCQTLAQRLSVDAERHGFYGETMDMDAGTSPIQQQKLAVVITASYEGEPPDNATHFVHWITNHNKKLETLEYAVFGCGHSDWAATFQKIPTIVDENLDGAGAKRLVPRGFADAAKGDILGAFDTWADDQLWPALKGSDEGLSNAQASPSGLDLEIYQKDRAAQLRQDVQEGRVEEIRVLSAPGVSEKRHLEIQLPSNMAYEPGDYLAVLPLNPDVNVQRIMKRYNILWDATIIIKSNGSSTTLPTDTPISVSSLLKGYVELAQPATKKDIRRLEEIATETPTKSALRSLASTDFDTEVLTKRASILDILETHPNIDLPFNALLSMFPPMRARYYSISSSPLIKPTACTITYSVLDQASSYSGHGPFLGVASSYLRSLSPGDPIRVAVKPANKNFRLPLTPERTPILMFCAGTGIAPFRSFIQHRAEMIKAGPGNSSSDKPLAAAMLFVGCRSRTRDRLYAEELDAWSAIGAVDVRYAFSDDRDDASACGCAHVQDRMWMDRDEVREMWERGAKIYVCGSPGLAGGVAETARRMVRETLGGGGGRGSGSVVGEGGNGEERLREWFERQKAERFVTDVFA